MAILYGTAGAMPTATTASGSAAVGLGKQTDLWVSEAQGRWYTQAVNGNVFIGSTLVAGTIIPISTATAATFVLYNPLGSGVNAQLISHTLGISVATVIVSPIGLGFSSGVGGAVVVPSSVTTVSIRNGLLGGGKTSQCAVYSAATVVATTYFKTMYSFSATSGAFNSSITYNFDGAVILPPGVLVHVVGLVAPSTSASTQDFVWIENPI